MTPAQAGVLRRQIAERWPEATELEVQATPDGATVTMRLDGGWQHLRVTPDGPLLEFLLSRPLPGVLPVPPGGQLG